MDLEISQLMDQLRKARSVAKGIVTRKANKLNELLTAAGENTNAIKEIANDLDGVSKQFQNAHEAYHSLLKDEQALTESTVYSNTVSELVSELRVKTEAWLQQPAPPLQEDQNEVQPHDSASTVGSRRSSSIRSSSSARAKAAAKQAALEAKANALKKMHELQMEELKIQEMKSQVELQGEIAAAEAEKIVFEQCEANETCLNEEEARPPSVHWQHSPKDSVNVIPVKHPVSSKCPESQPKQRPKGASLEQQHSSSAPEWFPNQSPLYRQNNGQPYDYPLQRLMETHGRQNMALQQIVQQQQQSVMALTLPQPTIKPFKGEPIEYCDFIRSFEHLQVEQTTLSPSARLYYLIQYTSGPAQDLMKSCLSMNPEQGYTEARRLLKERYGQEYRIAAAHVRTLTEGPIIKSEDGNALLQFSVQLTSCTNTLKEIGSLGKLDHPENLRRVINRLPFGMRLKWRDTVDRIIESKERDVTIEDVTKFVTAKTRAATHPIFGKVVNENKGKQEDNKGRRQFGSKAGGFATQGNEGRVNKSACPCNANHWLSRCDKFRKWSLEERRKYVKDNKLCLNCLTSGHFVRSCAKQSFCKVEGCMGKHSTFLHPKPAPLNDGERKDLQNHPPATHEEKREVNSNRSSNGYVKTCPKSSRSKGSSVTGLSVVPVRVRTKGKL